MKVRLVWDEIKVNSDEILYFLRSKKKYSSIYWMSTIILSCKQLILIICLSATLTINCVLFLFSHFLDVVKVIQQKLQNFGKWEQKIYIECTRNFASQSSFCVPIRTSSRDITIFILNIILFRIPQLRGFY